MQIFRSRCSRGIGDFDVVHYLRRPSGLGHPGSSSFVLHYARSSLPGGDAVPYVHGESVFTDLRFGQLRFDFGLDLSVAEVPRRVGNRGGRSGNPHPNSQDDSNKKSPHANYVRGSRKTSLFD